MSTQVSHRVDRGRGFGVDTIGGGRGRVGATPEAKSPAPMTRPRVRDREPSGSPRKVAPLRPGWVIVLGIVARVGLALLVTAGFASGLALYAGLSRAQPEHDPGVRRRLPLDLGPRLRRVMRMSDLKEIASRASHHEGSRAARPPTFAATGSACSSRLPSQGSSQLSYPSRPDQAVRRIAPPASGTLPLDEGDFNRVELLEVDAGELRPFRGI